MGRLHALGALPQGETVYDIELDGEDCITEEDALNLTAGEWEIYLLSLIHI